MPEQAMWGGIVNYTAILLSLTWLISFVTTIILDKDKKETTDKNFRIIKRAGSIFGLVLCAMFVVLVACTSIPDFVGFIGEVVFFLASIILLWTNKKSRQ